MLRWVLLLALPVALFYAASFGRSWLAGRQPTGFIQYDQAYYLANAREYLDADDFSIAYRNPFDPDAAAPRIYFQPMTALLAACWKLTGADPGVIYLCFGALMVLACLAVAFRLFRSCCGLSTPAHKLTFLCLVWGGGGFTVAAWIVSLCVGRPFPSVLGSLDPFGGWWMLNLGRNLVYPTEALYHALVLAIALCAFRRSFRAALALLVLLCVSHPYTGIEAALILLAWAALEKLVVRDRRMPWYVLPSAAAITAAHVGYYLLFLSGFPGHQAVFHQWLGWELPLASQLLADGPLLLLAGWWFLDADRRRASWADPFQRFLVVWFLVATALVHHELVLTSRQPIHFSHGYTWIPLFLLAAPALVDVFQRLGALRSRALAPLAAGTVLSLALADNAAWFALKLRHPDIVSLTPEVAAVLDTIEHQARRQELLLSEDSRHVGYLACVYTPVRAWASYPLNTPDYARRRAELDAFFRSGVPVPAWRGRSALILFSLDAHPAPGLAPADEILRRSRSWLLVRRHF